MYMNIQALIIAEIIKNPWIIGILIWSLIWKMIALWKSARNNHLTIFILIMFLNTIGIFEISYILYLNYKNKRK
ncbi:MAG: DUF5652 family protein [Candidatus Pacebacteria bacterium]|nr:DUF5652 family protein [Candidatus Paceibacterota bacterium]